jgi:hypothetical protein
MKLNLSLVFVLLALCGCDGDDSSKNTSRSARPSDEAMAAEEQLLSDPGKAMPELIRRLRSSVKKRDGLLIVDSPLGFSVLSANSAWMITCGAGITVAFGRSTSGESGDDAKVLIAYAFVSREECQNLAPAVGKEIQAIVNGE